MPIHSRILHGVVNAPPVKKLLTENRLIVRAYFEQVYLKADPYELETEPERLKFDEAFAMLGAFRGARALEIGCGEGRLTRRLLPHADRIQAFDLSANAIRRARRANPDPARISYAVDDLLKSSLPRRAYDLVFCSEVLHYFSRTQLDQAIRRVLDFVVPGGLLLLVNSRAKSDDASGIDFKAFGARTILERFESTGRLRLVDEASRELYRISVGEVDVAVVDRV